MALEQMMARASAMQTEEQSREPSKASILASMPTKKIPGSTKRNRKRQGRWQSHTSQSIPSRQCHVWRGQNRGSSLTKNDLIISSACSKAGDKDFYEAAMKEYNKEKHDEYNTLHFADNIVVDDKNLPKVFTPSMTGAT
jgi:hypothetical protein